MRSVRFHVPTAAVLTIFAITLAKPAPAQSLPSSPSDRKTLSDFSRHAKEYINQEHDLAADKMKPTSDVSKLEQERKQLRDAVQQSRPNARQGDFFTPDAARVFRKLLANVLNGPGSEKIKSSLNHAEPGAPAAFQVNAEFPNRNGQPIQSVPPTVLRSCLRCRKGWNIASQERH